MHATMRRFYCTARCWLSLMQVDRSLCMTTMCVGMSSTTCAFCQELSEGTHRNYTRRLSGSDREVAGSVAFGAAARFPSPERWRRSRLKPETGVHVHALEAWRHAIACRKQRARCDRGTSGAPTQAETC